MTTSGSMRRLVAAERSDFTFLAGLASAGVCGVHMRIDDLERFDGADEFRSHDIRRIRERAIAISTWHGVAVIHGWMECKVRKVVVELSVQLGVPADVVVPTKTDANAETASAAAAPAVAIECVGRLQGTKASKAESAIRIKCFRFIG